MTLASFSATESHPNTEGIKTVAEYLARFLLPLKARQINK